MPAAVADGVVERGADGASRGFQLGTTVDEDDGDVYVVAAGRPVQRRLGAVTAGVVVGVGSGFEEHSDGAGCLREVPGPVGGHV
jgi:hypothetical protein